MLGGGAGHILDMINRIKANKAMRRRSSYFKAKTDFIKITEGKEISIKEVSNEELVEIRKKIIKIRKQEGIKTIFILLISLLLTLLLLWLTYNHIDL